MKSRNKKMLWTGCGRKTARSRSRILYCRYFPDVLSRGQSVFCFLVPEDQTTRRWEASFVTLAHVVPYIKCRKKQDIPGPRRPGIFVRRMHRWMTVSIEHTYPNYRLRYGVLVLHTGTGTKTRTITSIPTEQQARTTTAHHPLSRTNCV